MTVGYLYRLDFSSGKSYIGITFKTPKSRFKNHRNSATQNDSAVYRAWRKYGEPKLSVLAVIEDYDLKDAEIKAIKIFGTKVPNGYNVSDGGDGAPGVKRSEETIERVAKIHRGRKRSEETCRRISEAKKGVPRGEVSKETRAKLSERMRGKKNSLGTKFSEESRKKCSLAQVGNKKGAGRKQTKDEIEKRVASFMLTAKETAIKVSKALKGRPSPLRGRVMPEEHRKKIAESNKGRVFSEETRAKMSAAQVRRKARERAEREQTRGE